MWKPKRRAPETRRTTAQRGYGSRWQRYARWYLGRNPLCRECERQGVTSAATQVDHIRPHRGDQALFWDVVNHQPLCGRCHAIKTRAGL